MSTFAICQICGKKFQARNDYETKARKYCSRKCANISFKGRSWLNKPPAYIKCKNCNREIAIYPSRKDRVFCNRKCQREHEANQLISKICPECNQIFRVTPSRQTDLYCTHKCYLAVLGRGGENNPSWKGGRAHYYGPNWKEQAEKTRKRDNYTCQACGINQDNYYRQLDVHHIKSFKSFGLINYKKANRLTNLITLCSSCHIKVEYNKIPLPKRQ